ncbi:hypothetical protein EVAR_24727_1 [Eumeta japonica]|uniref:Uncharacterized protein n=1 Tax=Eumeta variegata TaxID=151549 RepID=A0A4C1VFI8_EUMVA|nr:hypothetical protein EVAR_24727_1 [Eumeta japonica]
MGFGLGGTVQCTKLCRSQLTANEYYYAGVVMMEKNSSVRLFFPNLLQDKGPTIISGLDHEPDVVFGRRRRRTSFAHIVSQISATVFELVNPVINSSKG